MSTIKITIDGLIEMQSLTEQVEIFELLYEDQLYDINAERECMEEHFGSFDFQFGG